MLSCLEWNFAPLNGAVPATAPKDCRMLTWFTYSQSPLLTAVIKDHKQTIARSKESDLWVCNDACAPASKRLSGHLTKLCWWGVLRYPLCCTCYVRFENPCNFWQTSLPQLVWEVNWQSWSFNSGLYLKYTSHQLDYSCERIETCWR